MIISCIVAMNQDRIIGNDNQIPWYLPADLKYFKKITTGHHILNKYHTYSQSLFCSKQLHYDSYIGGRNIDRKTE